MKEESYAKMLTAMDQLKQINQILVSEALTSVFDLLDAVITSECRLYGDKEEDMPDDLYFQRNEAFDKIVLSPSLTVSQKAALLKEKETNPTTWQGTSSC